MRALSVVGFAGLIALSSACGNDTDAQTCASLGVPQTGTCWDDLLYTCSESGIVSTQECADACLIRDNATAACYELPDGTSLVKGTVSYEDRAPLVSGGLGAVQLLPVRGATVSVVTTNGNQVLSTRSVSEIGSFAIDYVPTPGQSVYVLVATASSSPTRTGRVVNSSGQVHGLQSDPIVDQGVAEITMVATQAGSGRAFNVFDQAVAAADFIHGTMNEPTIKPFSIRWYIGSNDGSYYDGSSIHLLGNSGDDDGYDDTVIMHEIGHYMSDNYAVDDSPGGAHDGSPTTPSLAWGEGFATYFNMAVRGEPIYTDSNAQGGFGDDLDSSVTKVPAGGVNTQNVSENMIAEILWDAGDADRQDASDDDPVKSLGHAAVLAVAQGFRISNPGAGRSGIDLADWIATVFTSGVSNSHCSGLADIILGERLFPFPYQC
ncbi:MAG: hypothetical protein IPL79_11520 [Myxococcales bacterium]|nr:hypothetical protein [Myxococcales bacterium]